MQSFLWSFILDFKRILLCLSATFFAYTYKQNLTIIVVIQTKTKSQEKSNLLPKTSEETASTNNFIDMPIIERLIKKEKIYSAFPWPKLWPSSRGSLAILLPIKVIAEAKISPALFAASAIIAWLPLIKPTKPFIISKNILPKMPAIPTHLVSLYLSKKSPRNWIFLIIT